MDKNNYYVSGNTVREMEAEPLYKERRQTREELERIHRQKSRRNAVRRNREKAMHMGKGRVFLLSLCVIGISLTAGVYVRLQASVTGTRREIANIEKQITDLKADNDTRYKNLQNSVDLTSIRKKAIDKLGMRYPKKNQIVYYSVDKTSFMDQYEDIPER